MKYFLLNSWVEVFGGDESSGHHLGTSIIEVDPETGEITSAGEGLKTGGAIFLLSPDYNHQLPDYLHSNSFNVWGLFSPETKEVKTGSFDVSHLEDDNYDFQGGDISTDGSDDDDECEDDDYRYDEDGGVKTYSSFIIREITKEQFINILEIKALEHELLGYEFPSV